MCQGTCHSFKKYSTPLSLSLSFSLSLSLSLSLSVSLSLALSRSLIISLSLTGEEGVHCSPVREREKERERKREKEREKERERGTEKEGGRETKREGERERKSERELHVRASRKCGRAESLSVPHSVSQSVSMRDYYINIEEQVFSSEYLPHVYFFDKRSSLFAKRRENDLNYGTSVP